MSAAHAFLEHCAAHCRVEICLVSVAGMKLQQATHTAHELQDSRQAGLRAQLRQAHLAHDTSDSLCMHRVRSKEQSCYQGLSLQSATARVSTLHEQKQR